MVKKSNATKQPRIVILVPFGSEDSSRIEIWEYIHKRLSDEFSYPIYTGADQPESIDVFNISLSRNLAAQKADADKKWDIAIIHDADTIINRQQILAGVDTVWKSGAVTYPFTERYELDRTGTEIFLSENNSAWQGKAKRHTGKQSLGGCVIVRRDLWDLVRGFDTGFKGWGHEDGAFAIACGVLSLRGIKRIPGNSLHLEHTYSPSKNKDSPIYQANHARIMHYVHATGQNNPEELIKKLRDQSLSVDADAGIKWQ